MENKTWSTLLKPYFPFYFLIASYTLSVYWLAKLNDLEHLFSLGMYNDLILKTANATIVLIIAGYLIWLAIVQKEKQPLQRAARDFKLYILNTQNIFEVAAPLLIIPLFISSFTCFKSIIPLLNPFYLDAVLANIDKTLHGGMQPWEITHWVVSSTNATYSLNILYGLWFVVMWGFLFWQVLRLNKPTQRQQFFIAFILCWIIPGSVLAYYLSSAGPCYYGRVTNLLDIYAPLMQRLQTMHMEYAGYESWKGLGIVALTAQEILWESYSNTEIKTGAGISAMPSVHVSIATLMALSAWQSNKIFGLIMTFYAVIIQFGSVHTGWHYAVDGYLAIILTLVIWYFSGLLAQRLYTHR